MMQGFANWCQQFERHKRKPYKHPRSNAWYIEFSKRKAKRIHEVLYSDADVFLPRKRVL